MSHAARSPWSVSHLLLVVWAIGLAGSARAELTSWPPDAPHACDAAIQGAEHSYNLPPHLLAAIGRVESGRRDPVSGTLAPWPWTIDVEGQGHVYATEAEAIAAVRAFRAAGRMSIDVGCMQVNLVQHPGAFASLEVAFDPVGNATYAARFLTQLRGGTADWMTAAGLYHSATPALAAEYRAKVAAMMPFGDGFGLAMAPPRTTLPMPIPPMASGVGSLRGMVIRTTAQLAAPPAGVIGRGLAAYRAMAMPRRG